MMEFNTLWKSLLLLPIFGLATLLLYSLVASAPTIRGNGKINLKFPSNVDELKKTADVLTQYYENNEPYVVLLFCSAYIYKQAFAIPGSALLNILGGALFGVKYGLPLCCLLTAMGATISYFLSSIFLKQAIKIWLPLKIEQMEEKIHSNKDNMIYFLLSLRLFPATPNWLINIVSPIVGVPVHTFFLTVFLGLIPYNYLCVQSGSMLTTITSVSEVLTWKSALQLVALALAALGPSVFRQRVTS